MFIRTASSGNERKQKWNRVNEWRNCMTVHACSMLTSGGDTQMNEKYTDGRESTDPDVFWSGSCILVVRVPVLCSSDRAVDGCAWSADTSSLLYSLPEVHKLNVPVHPIVSFVQSPTYQLSKHLSDVGWLVSISCPKFQGVCRFYHHSNPHRWRVTSVLRHSVSLHERTNGSGDWSCTEAPQEGWDTGRKDIPEHRGNH